MPKFKSIGTINKIFFIKIFNYIKKQQSYSISNLLVLRKNRAIRKFYNKNKNFTKAKATNKIKRHVSFIKKLKKKKLSLLRFSKSSRKHKLTHSYSVTKNKLLKLYEAFNDLQQNSTGKLRSSLEFINKNLVLGFIKKNTKNIKKFSIFASYRK